MTPSVHSLLKQAHANAAPHTGLLAKQLRNIALAVLAVGLLVAALPHVFALVQHYFGDIKSLGTSIAAFGVFAATGVLKAIWFVVKSLSGGFGLVCFAAVLTVLHFWSQARRYVMQSAIDLAVKADISEEEGKSLVRSFVTTHKRVSNCIGFIAIFAGVNALVSLFFFMGLKPPEGSALPALWLFLPWALLGFATLPVDACLPPMTNYSIGSYALYRACNLPPEQFLRELQDQHAFGTTVNQTLVHLQRKGLVESSASNIACVRDYAKHEVPYAARRRFESQLSAG